MTTHLAPLSYTADQFLAGLAAHLGPEPGSNEWLDALLTQHHETAAEAGGDVDLGRIETAVHDRLAHGETGERVARDEVATRAGRHAVEVGHDVATTADVAFVLLDTARDLVAAEPALEPVSEPAGVPLSFTADQFLGSLLHDWSSGQVDDLLVVLIDRHRDAAEAAQSGLDLDAVADAARRGTGSGTMTRDQIAAAAGLRAAGHGRDVAATSDVALAILDAAQDLEPAVSIEAPVAVAAEAPPAAVPPPPAGRPRTFRLFVSSTFEDFKAERDVLRERVFPRLRTYCAERGARFQAIDLRWGVSEETALDQQTINICLDEIRRCRRVTPRPNFLVLLGNHYGWRPPPPQVAADEFEQMLERVPAGKRELLAYWYVRDENAVPPEYRLQPRRGERGAYADVARWAEVERELHELLAAAADEERKAAYAASATHQEIAVGALSPETQPDEVFCYIRELTDDPDPAEAPADDPLRRFVDLDQTPLDALKAELDGFHVVRHEVAWDTDRTAPGTDRLDEFAVAVAAALEESIRRELEEPRPELRPEGPELREDDELDPEGLAHHDFAEERIRFFVGRDGILGTVAGYLDGADPAPLVVHGAGGTGKSAVIGEAIRRSRQDHPGAHVVYRFIGATPGSSDGRALLDSLCRELARRGYGAEESAVPSGFQELVSDFSERLAAAPSGPELFVFLDSLDQLSAGDGARSLAWLPVRLPEHVRLVVSTRPGETLEPLERRGAILAELGEMSRAEGDTLLGRWLEDAARTLRPEQRQAVLDAFESPEEKGNPLYLKLAFEEARRWSSGETPERLVPGIEGIIRGNLFDRLAREDSHGEVLVSHALGYLALSRYGLAEDELLDLLSRDPNVYGWFIVGAYHLPPDLLEWAGRYEARGGQAPEVWLEAIRKDGARTEELRRFLEDVLPESKGPSLPVVLWSRLSFDLEPYLSDRVAEGAVLMAFYHRELEEAAKAEYLGEAKVEEIHGRLADYFRSKADPAGDATWGGEGRSDLRGLSELPFHLTGAGRWDQLHDTLTDFRFLERKAADVGVQRRVDEEGHEAVTYTGVYRLLEDFDLALRGMPDGEGRAGGRRPLIVTAVDFGDGLVVRCPWCNVSHTFGERCSHCGEHHDLDGAWLGKELACPNEACKGPLKVNTFTVERPTES